MTNRLVRLLLIGAVLTSLALNAAVLAVGWQVASLMRDVGTQEATLPREWRRPFRQALRDDPEVRNILRSIVEARGHMVAALTAQPPDLGAADDAAEQVRRQTARLQERPYAVMRQSVLGNAEAGADQQ